MKKLLLLIMLLALCLMLTAYVSPDPVALSELQEGGISLIPLGTYATGIFDGAAAEIVAYDAESQRLFSVNSSAPGIDVLDLSDPRTPTLLQTIDVSAYGGVATSVDISNGVMAVSIVAADKVENGTVAFFDTDGQFLNVVEVGPLPDMITFTPDGMKVLTANEAEPALDYSSDPEGSIAIIDVSGGIDALTQENVTLASFAAFNDVELDDSIRIFSPDATVAQDLEPEYIAISDDSSMAWVSLQENNAMAIVDIEAGEVTDVVGLGFKDYNRPLASLETFTFEDLPVLGTTEAGQDILLGGFSGLAFEGMDEETGHLYFITHPDRGPNADPVDVDDDGVNEQPLVLPDYQATWVRFALDMETGELTITEQVGLTDADGTPITGRPNLAGPKGVAHADEEPVDLLGNDLEYDPLGGDIEGIVRAEDGSYWMVDEYRPAIYHFDANGVLIDRFVPEGANGDSEAEDTVEVGTEALPSVFAQRRANRGLEAVALEGNMLYAFTQSPIDNPDVGNDANSKASTVVRILAFDTAAGASVGQYLYMLDGDGVDKIGGATAIGDGEFLVIERDSAVGPESKKYIYKINLSGATNIHTMDADVVGANTGLERQSALGLARMGIYPVQKSLYVDLTAIGYHMVDKPEGLALIDENTLAILNDNDFRLVGTFDQESGMLDDNPDAMSPILGLITLYPNGFDASDRDDAINIQYWPVLGMYQPDAIASYTVDGETYIVSANEGDSRDWPGYSEETRVGDLLLDWSVFPNVVELQSNEMLGRMKTTIANGDADGDGLVETIYGFGARSFSIWDANGQLVFDSGSQFAEITAEAYPNGFNANGDDDSFDNRSDDKGSEPEAIEIATIAGVTYAFIGLERIGGIMIYDISDPIAPEFIEYVNNRDFAGNAEAGTAGDLAPESIEFIAAEDSPTGQALLVVANEFSGTVTVYLVE